MDGASLNGALRTAKLERDEQGNYRLPASFQKDMANRQIPRVVGCWQTTKFSVRAPFLIPCRLDADAGAFL